MKKYYQILGLEECATLEEVEEKYNKLLKEFDPDTQSDDDLKEFFKSERDKIKEAYLEISSRIKNIDDDKVVDKEVDKLDIDDSNDILIYYQVLKLSADATLAEISQKYNILLDEFNPDHQSDNLREFFEKEQEKIKYAYNTIIKHLSKEGAEEKDAKGLNEGVIDLEAHNLGDNDLFHKFDETNTKLKTLNTMENEKLIITDFMKNQLDKMTYWAKLFGVLGFIGTALMIVVAFAMFSMGSDIDMYGIGSMTGFLYIIIGVIYFFPSKYIYGFSKQCRRALNTNSQESISDAFDKLASVFTFWGVLTVIVLGIYAIVFIAAISSTLF